MNLLGMYVIIGVHLYMNADNDVVVPDIEYPYMVASGWMCCNFFTNHTERKFSRELYLDSGTTYKNY